VGYIIGARVAAIMFAGGIFSWLVLMPAIYFFGSHLSGRSIPAQFGQPDVTLRPVARVRAAHGRRPLPVPA